MRTSRPTFRHGPTHPRDWTEPQRQAYARVVRDWRSRDPGQDWPEWVGVGGGDAVLMVQMGRMCIGIERDGYVHT